MPSYRTVFDGHPVTFSYAQEHGGPATTAAGTTSVGTAAVRRFQRPVAYQDLPDARCQRTPAGQPVVGSAPRRWSIRRGRYAGGVGVISMYPLKGGSGLVEVEPDWTLCPPWVNKNV